MSKLSKLTVGCNIYVPSRLAVTHRNTCDVCVESSMKKAPESKSAPGFEKASEPGELVYSDLLGPLPESRCDCLDCFMKDRLGPLLARRARRKAL